MHQTQGCQANVTDVHWAPEWLRCIKSGIGLPQSSARRTSSIVGVFFHRELKRRHLLDSFCQS